MKIRINKEFYTDLLSFTFYDRDSNGIMRAVTDMVIEEVKEGSIVPITTHISLQDAQSLIDQLWDCGLRPTEGTGSAGSLAATQKHLNDMRKIVSKKLDINLDNL